MDIWFLQYSEDDGEASEIAPPFADAETHKEHGNSTQRALAEFRDHQRPGA